MEWWDEQNRIFDFLEAFALGRENKLLLCFFFLIFTASILFQPVLTIGLNDVEYGLFCIWNDVDNPRFLERVAEGKFDVLLPKIGTWRSNNTLALVSTSEVNELTKIV